MKAKEFIPTGKPRNFVAKNAQTSGAGKHRDSDKKKDQEQGKVKHKKDLIPMEDVAEATSAAVRMQRAADRQSSKSDASLARTPSSIPKKKEPKKQDVSEGSAHGYNVVRWYHKNKNPSKITAWLKKEAGLPKETKLYFDDADLVLDSDTIVPEALVDDTLKFNDLLTALVNATGGTPKEKTDGVYRSQGMEERVRDPEDWDEGNTEPPNNFAVYINGKKWKVFKGRGQFADDYKEIQHYRQLRTWAEKKSAKTGKKWTVGVTGEQATESVKEASALEKFRKDAAEREKKHNDVEKEMKARHARGEEDMKGAIDRLEKHLNNK
jgi:hypothetical protein